MFAVVCFGFVGWLKAAVGRVIYLDGSVVYCILLLLLLTWL
jgi:hypothetical protein